jgi:hypothetical protein
VQFVEQYGILWGIDGDLPRPYCVGCYTARERWVPMSCFHQGAAMTTYRTYVCPHGHPQIVLDHLRPPPMTVFQAKLAADLFTKRTNPTK